MSKSSGQLGKMLTRANVLMIGLLCLIFNPSQCTKPKTRAKTHVGRSDSLVAVLEAPNEKEFSTRKPISDLVPKCKDFLRTALDGRWIRQSPPAGSNYHQRKQFRSMIKRKQAKLESDMKSVWQNRGIPQDPWSSTNYCGYHRKREKNGSSRPPIGTWCDPKSSKPCCDNHLSGKCVPAAKHSCTCPMCADVRKLDHAELMKWTPYNNYWCKWKHYNAEEACTVIEDSPVKELYYVGDSYMQSMYLGLLMILTDRPIYGSWKKGGFTPDEYQKCSNYGLTYFKSCRAMIQSLDEMRYKNALCGDGRNVTFKADFEKYYSTRYSKEFRQLIRRLVGKPGTFVVVGIGFHVRFDLYKAIKQYLHPAMKHRRVYYRQRPEVPNNRQWPQVLFSLPMNYGLLKPSAHLKAHSITKQQKFEAGMRKYCKRNNIEILDFTSLTKNVHSFDGVHYGVAVNNEKNQIFLNYLATLD